MKDWWEVDEMERESAWELELTDMSITLGGSCPEDCLVLAGGTDVGELLLRAFESSDGSVDVPSDAPKRSTPSRTTLFRESCILDRALVSILFSSLAVDRGRPR